MNHVKQFMYDFFNAYYLKRDLALIESMVSDEIISIGLLADEMGTNKKMFHLFVEKQMKDVSSPIPYTVMDYIQKEVNESQWNVFASIELIVERTVTYRIRLTASIHKEQDNYKIDMLHCSESSYHSNQLHPTKEIGRIISEMVPGGIISRYAQDHAGVYIANEHFLRMFGYATFDDLMKMCQGDYIRLIDPEDVEKYLYTTRFIQKTGKQCSCEYRLLHRNQKYVWVHDVGRLGKSTDGKDLIVSVLTDMTEQKAQQKRLESESNMDQLTQVYNRKGAMKHYETMPKRYQCYAFFVVDVDNFKQVNDLYGHVKGDLILRYIADVLKDSFSKQGVVCRLGGDEFSVFVSDFASFDAIQQTMFNIIDRYKKHLDSICPLANSSLSIGGVYGQEITDLVSIYEKADMNMYQSKYNPDSSLYITKMDT